MFMVFTIEKVDAVSQKMVYRFYISEEINASMARKVSQAINEAILLKSDLILIHMNTYGGLLDAADSIRTRLLNCPIPVIVFIDNNAASAGALIAIACNKIYMRAGSSIGAATVVDQTAQALPDKYQSYMRAMMRSTAEARGRDPHIAEAMVDPTSYIKGISDSGKVLTFTTSEAIKHGYCNGMAENWREILTAENINDYQSKLYNPTWLEILIGYLIHPAISGILIMVMLGGLYFELQHPGIGFPLFAGVLAAILYFAPLYAEGLAANWEIFLFVIGLVLIALELFVIPGFGIAGILGIILMILGLSASMVNNNGFDFSGIVLKDLLGSVAIVVLSMAGSVIVFFTLGRGLMHSKSFNKMVLQDVLATGSESMAMIYDDSIIGKQAVASTVLRPSGKITYLNEVINATAENGFIEKDKQVEIIRYTSMGAVVREIIPD